MFAGRWWRDWLLAGGVAVLGIALTVAAVALLPRVYASSAALGAL